MQTLQYVFNRKLGIALSRTENDELKIYKNLENNQAVNFDRLLDQQLKEILEGSNANT